MIAVLGRIGALTTVYLLALTSVAPGDVLTGIALAAVVVATGRWIRTPDDVVTDSASGGRLRRLAGVPALIGGTVADMAKESWTVAGYCLRGRLPAPGLVRVPIARPARGSSTAWAVRVGLAPASVVVEVDANRGELLVHVPDARDPDAVRRTQQISYERRQARVFP
jgi:multisubunit Na+/H+ antiporter MnhE subunit